MGFHKLRSGTSWATATSFCHSSNYHKQKRIECFLCCVLSAVALKKQAKKCYFKAIRNKTEQGTKQKNPLKTKIPHKPEGKTQHIPCFEAHQRSELCLDPSFLPPHPYPCFLKSPSKVTAQLCYSTRSLPY